MKLDFNKSTPQAQTLEEAQQIINALWIIVVELQANEITAYGAFRTAYGTFRRVQYRVRRIP